MKILLIEDDKELSNSLKIILEMNGFTVDQLYDGKAGQVRINIHGSGYDFVILDFILPYIQGDAICRNVRENGVTLPILMLTGKDSTEDKVRALDAGADDYLVKPFSTKELIARIHAILRRPQEVIKSELTVRDIVLNSTTRKVTKGDKEIVLTFKEFAIFEYLIRNANQIVLRDQLLDHVWDFNFPSFSNLVDVHINKLRKKLSPEGSVIIETVRGIGYRINI